MCLAFPENRFLPPPPGPVPKRRLEIQQSQSVWELNNQQPDAGIRRDRTAIQTAGAVSGGPSSEMWRKKRFTRVPSRPTPVAMAAPRPSRLAARTEPRPLTGLRARRAFPRASWFVVEGARSGSGKDESRCEEPASGGQRPRPAPPPQAPRPGTRGRLERRPLGLRGAAAGRGTGARVPAAPRTREPRVPDTPVAQWPWFRHTQDRGVRVPAAPLPRQT